MGLVIDCVFIDCVDLEVMTSFWCQALDLEHVWTDHPADICSRRPTDPADGSR